MPRAGRYVRTLALQRRGQAFLWFTVSVLCAVLPLGVSLAWPTAAVVFVVSIYLLGWAGAIAALQRGHFFWRRANHADQGAQAEEQIASLLLPLEQEGWQIDYGVRDRTVGDIDVVLCSPRQHNYTIDVKSHRGQVILHQGQLCRQYGPNRYPFEKNFLAQAQRQAAAMKQRHHLNHVTPMIVFANAQVKLHRNPIHGVYVLERYDLLSQLRSLG